MLLSIVLPLAEHVALGLNGGLTLNSVDTNPIHEELGLERLPFGEESMLDHCLMPRRNVTLFYLHISILHGPLPVGRFFQLFVLLDSECLLQLLKIDFSSILAGHSLEGLSPDAHRNTMSNLISDSLEVPTSKYIVDNGLENASVDFLVVESVHFEGEKFPLLHIDGCILPG